MAKKRKKQWWLVTFAEAELKTYRVLATSEEEAIEEALETDDDPVSTKPDRWGDGDPDGNCRGAELDENQGPVPVD